MRNKALKLILIFLTKLYLLVLKVFKRNMKLYSSGIFLSSIKVNGKTNIIVNTGNIINSIFEINGQNNTLKFEDFPKIRNCKFIINGKNCCLILRGGRYIKDSTFELLDSNTEIIVDINTGLNKNRIVVAGKGNSVKIGKDCIFAENAEVWSSDTHSIIDLGNDIRINQDKPIYIGDHVWIGNRALIHKGVSIGNNSIVAAGSVVTKDIPENTLAGGIPAKTIKNNITWNVNRI